MSGIKNIYMYTDKQETSNIYRFSRPFSSSSSFNFRKMCLQFRPGHSGMCECSFQFRLWSIKFETLSFNFVLCHPFSSTAIQIRRSQYSWAQDSKNNFVYWHSFSSKFQSNSSPRRKGPITLDEFEWQNNEFVRKNDEFDPTFLTRLASQTKFSDN